MHGQNLTEGNIRKQLWSLAWPLMLSLFFHTLYNAVDAFWVGKISPEAIAAVSISQLVLWIMVAVSMGITIGSGVIMAMHIGAKRIEKAEQVLGQSFVLAVIAAAMFTVVSLLFKNQFLSASGATGAIFPLAQVYFTIIAAGSVLLFLMIAVVFAFNSQGNTTILTFLFALSSVMNIILDPLFIFGFKGFPALGIAGAAYATLISQLVFFILAVYVLSRKTMMIRLKRSNLTLSWVSVKAVLAIGIPASLAQVTGPVGLAVLTAIISSVFLEAGAISFSIAFRVEFFALLPAIGFGFAAMAMIGQCVGAGNLKRAAQVYTTATLYAFVLATVVGIGTIIFANQLISLFTSDPLVVEYTKTYLWSVPLTFGFFAVLMIDANAFQGIGRSWPGFWLIFLKFAVIAIPASLLLIWFFHAPIFGVWAAILVSNIIAAVVGFVWFRKALQRLAKA